MENITSKGTIFGTLIAQAGPKGDTGKTGDRGLTGEAGYSPIKGVDYFTQEDIVEIREGIEGDLTGEYNKNAIEKTNIFNTNAKETTTSFDLNAENKTKEYNDNALAEIEKYNSNAIEKSNNFDTNFENKTSKFDSNYDEKTKEFNDNNDLGIQNYNNNAKKQMEIFDANFTEKLEAFNNNAGTKFNGFNINSDKALAEYNKNHTAKMKEFDDNYDTKTKTFDDNAAAKLDEYNKNDKTKTDAYNANDKAKTEAYNNNASNKEETFNTNAEVKQNEFDENASDKLAEYNQNAKELINKVEQVQAENEALKAENKLIKEQIPSANVSGNNIHVEDSGSLDFEWRLKGGNRQKTREGYNLIDNINAMLNYIEDGKSFNIKNDGAWNVTETTGFMKIDIPDIILKAGKAYTLCRNFSTNQNSILYNSEGNKVISIGWGEKYKTVTLAEDITIKQYQGGLEQGDNYIWLYEGNYDSTKVYEQCGASPSTSFPSEIETVGSNVNYFDKDNITNEFLDEKTGISSVNNAWECTNFIEVTEKQYCFSWESESDFFQTRVCFYENDKTFISGISLETGNTYKQIINIINNAKYIRISYSINVGGSIVAREKVKLEIGNKRTLYSPYMCGSVEKDVVNKNLFDKNNEKKGIAINTAGVEEASGTRSTTQYITVDKNKKVLYVNWSGKTGKQNPGYTILLSYDSNKKLITRQAKYNETSSKNWTFDISNASFIRVTYEDLQVNNGEYGVENTIISYEKTEYEEHQSQTAIMPIQQEMLTGDYVAEVEHHEYKKVVVDGTNYGAKHVFPNGNFKLYDFTISAEIKGVKKPKDWAVTEKETVFCTHLKTVNTRAIQNLNSEGITNTVDGGLLLKLDNATEETNTWTSETINAYLKQQYEAGTPITIYYKLETPFDLELTEEQKAVRDTKLYTYKNITNIDVSDELASIDVTYKKDLETEHNKLQNEIDEIKQLISTTETSALLLDNLQKDVEMEVE